MKFKSLTMRIWFIISVIVATIVIVVSLAFAFLMQGKNQDRSRDMLQMTHQIVLHALRDNPSNLNIGQFADFKGASHFVFDQKNDKIQFIAGQGKEAEGAFMRELAQSVVNGGIGTDAQMLQRTIQGQAYVIEVSPIEEKSFLVSCHPLVDRDDLSQIILVGLLVILVTLPVSKVIANNIAKPLKELEAYTKKIANKEWNSELELQNQDEIGRLAQAMKEMKEALRLADEEETKFLQSISHDLKTPVMVIMSYAQAILDGMYEDAAEDAAAIIQDEAIRLEKKIKQILYLNTLDYVLDNDKEQEEVYLDKLLPYLVANFQAVNSDLSWQLHLAAKPAVMLGSADRIRVSIENILENQLRYAAGSVRVSLREEASFWRIEVQNDGPPLPEKDLQQIFHSLYKGERGNFGLGLSISQKIVNFYRGYIAAENCDGGVRFTICYPKK